MDEHPGATLAHFAATLRFEDIPEAVVRRAEDLMLDWLASALAGAKARPVQANPVQANPVQAAQAVAAREDEVPAADRPEAARETCREVTRSHQALCAEERDRTRSAGRFVRCSGRRLCGHHGSVRFRQEHASESVGLS